jgi:ribosomal protein S18 acetylase RimI-like enzyme
VAGLGVQIREVQSDADVAKVADLMAAYPTWGAQQLREQYGVEEAPANPAQVAEGLSSYKGPGGMIVLAEMDDRPFGVAALRRLPDGAAEIKRMYVLPEARSLHIGSRMLDHLVASALDIGASVVRLDTAAFMVEAHRLYRSRGFSECPPYEGTEIAPDLHEHWLFFERKLAGNRPGGWRLEQDHKQDDEQDQRK